MDFTCNICGTSVVGCPIEKIDREIPSCNKCGSTVRFRSIVHLTSVALFGRSLALAEFPADPTIVGIGLSDWIGYAARLEAKFAYTNTYYHQPPLLDIANPVGERAKSCDFMISTDVFEHVAPPVQRAFTGAFNLLKPGGHLILTVPFTNEPATIEHFPNLHDYRIVRLCRRHVLVNKTKNGRYEFHNTLVFHGGPGTTLEMRVFCRADLERHLAQAGFIDIRFFDEDVPQWGILHKADWSLPILARRPL